MSCYAASGESNACMYMHGGVADWTCTFMKLFCALNVDVSHLHVSGFRNNHGDMI